MKDELETIISDRNLEANQYKLATYYGPYQIYAKDDYRLVLEPLKDMRNYYKVKYNYLFSKPCKLSDTKLYSGVQLDLFYNKPGALEEDRLLTLLMFMR
jgi:hypothetical protein